jgi:hypothetical protein
VEWDASYVTAAVVGGTTSVIGGGKFSNGAITGAFGYLFNHLLSKDSVRALFGSAKGHHPFAKQWANEYRELISEDALGVLGTNTIGHDVVWEGNHPNKWGSEHKSYNDVSGRRILENFFDEMGITPTNQLGTKQSYELLDRLNRHDFNVKMQDYVDVQRSSGRINMNRVFRPRGGTGQPGD